MESLVDRYRAAMVLSGVGDAVGFRNGGWEFNPSGKNIHAELKALGGVQKLNVSLPDWRVSDDTVMHLATAESLVNKSQTGDKEDLYQELAVNYKECMNDMRMRSAGATCRGGAFALQPGKVNGYRQPFDGRGGGCGAAMRAMCIGLRYPLLKDLDELISVSVESGRMTHHHPTGYLGALATALFTSYAVQGKPVREWGAGLMSVLPRALKYVESQGHYVTENQMAWSFFSAKWTAYLKERNIATGHTDPVFPKHYGVGERDAFYKSVSYAGWGGASGHDAPMIAYDALLGSGNSWEELVKRGMLHGGDSDSTGVTAAACYGAMYGFQGVPVNNYQNLEYRERLDRLGVQLYHQSHPDEAVDLQSVQSSTSPETKQPAATDVEPPSTVHDKEQEQHAGPGGATSALQADS